MTSDFAPEVVEAVLKHMNADHPDDSLLIARARTRRSDVAAARMAGLDRLGADFDLTMTGGGVTPLRVPWRAPLTERREIRIEVVHLYDEACATLGVTPRPHAVPFSRRLRAATAGAHEAAEHSGLMAELVAGELPLEDFVAYTAQLWLVYEALENAVDTVRALDDEAHASVRPFFDPALDRRAHLASDLSMLIGPRWREGLTPLGATATYRDHLAQLAATSPELVLAHHYTRYLGDLSGGLAIAAIAARTYGLSAETGLSFYRFEQIGQPKPYKDAYRARLDALPWDDATQQAVIDEVGVAYGLNSAVIDDVAHRTRADRVS